MMIYVPVVLSITVSVVVPLSIVVLTAAVLTLTSSTDYGTSGRYKPHGTNSSNLHS